MSVELVGLIPAAGQAKRVSPLPGSKELFPVGFREVEIDGHVQLRPKVVSQYLLDNMFRAGVRKVWIVLGRGKWDIMHYYGDGSQFGGHIAYLLMDRLWGMPYTLDQAYPWLNQATVLFGMPDTVFTPSNAFVRMLARHQETHADVTLGIFPTDRPEKLCPVKLDETGKVLGMTDKPTHSEIKNTWGCACWSPRFTGFMHDFLTALAPPSKEVVLADVFRAAIQEGLAVQGVYFEDGEYIDVGTPDDLVLAVRRFSGR
ncbi:MAG: dTDP-glucose pyrophosphorylase [Chloroflexi bacterium]|nr:MAG: dTDP-glucose pyrophosphorylase [Chloroflexota bacterium]